MTRTRPVTETLPSYDFLVYKDGDYYKIQDGYSLTKVYKDKDAYKIMEKVLSLIDTQGKVFFKTATFDLKQKLSINKKVIFEGSGTGTRFLINHSDAGFEINSPNVVLKNLSIEGVYETGPLILVNSDKCKFDNLWLYTGGNSGGTNGEGIEIGGSYNEVTDCYIEMRYQHSDGITIWKPKNTIKGCIFYNTVSAAAAGTTAAIEIKGTGDGNENIVVGNQIHSNGTDGGIAVEHGSSNIVANNRIESAFQAIRVTGYGGVRPYHNVVANNVIVSGSYGIFVYFAHDTIVANNSVIGTRKYAGIRVEGKSSTEMFDDIIIIGNSVQNSAWEGIKVQYMRHAIIKGNLIKNNGQGSSTYNYGISLNCVDDAIVSLNRCYDDQDTKTQSYGIYIDSECSGIQVFHNVLTENKLGAILNEAADTIFHKNIGFVTENSGEVTISAGNTYVEVSHGLDITPDINKFKIVPKDNLDGRSYWISDITSSSFRINISSSDTIDHVFGWSYQN